MGMEKKYLGENLSKDKTYGGNVDRKRFLDPVVG